VGNESFHQRIMYNKYAKRTVSKS